MMTIYSDNLNSSDITPIVDPITDLDLITEFDFFTWLREVSIEHLQRVWHAKRRRLHIRTPSPVLLWDLQLFLCWDQSLMNLSCFRTYEFRTSLGTSVFAPFPLNGLSVA